MVTEMPVLTGCISHSETKEEALANAKRAAELGLQGMEEEGRRPCPRNMSLLRLGPVSDGGAIEFMNIPARVTTIIVLRMARIANG